MKFGEVALQPPELTAKPRKSMSRGQVSRGGTSLSITRESDSHWAQQLSIRLFVFCPPLNLRYTACLWSAAWQEVTDPGDASEPRRCAPASGLLDGPAADCGGGESAGGAGLQGDEEAAAGVAGGSVSPPPSRAAARDRPVMAGTRAACCAGSGEQAGGPEIKAFPRTQPRAQSLGHQLPSSRKGSSVRSPSFLPGHYVPE